MTNEQALQIVEQARKIITLPGDQADLFREAVLILNKLVQENAPRKEESKELVKKV